MKANKTIKIIGALVGLCFITALATAQQKTIADDDLLKMLDSAGGNSSEEAASTDLAEVEIVETIEAIDAPADLAGIVDDLGMAEYDENEASSSGDLISVRLNKVGLEEAINLFAQLSGANIIVPELTEAAQISVNLKDVEWRPALQSILDAYNYELYQKVPASNVFSVRRRPAGAPEPQVVETFKLKYATVPNVASLIRELLPEDAKVSEFASRNMIVVKTSEASLSEIRSVITTIDIVRQQVYIESKFMELSDKAQKDLGIDWSVLQAYGLGTVGSTEQRSVNSDSSTKTDTDFTDANGLAYEDATGYLNNGQRIPGSGIFTLEGVTPSVSDVTTEGTSKVLTSVLSADEFRVVLSALEENKGVNVVSNPKVIVANEEKANISIVRKEPNLKQERTESLNDTPTEISFMLDPELPFFEYGIRLDVTPSINTSSNITVRINPSLTRKFGDKDAGATTYPIIDEKTIETVFNLASGQTAAIGGLTEVSDSEEERKIPVLGSIPFLGRLFSWKQTITDQRETIIFVTVGLANTMDFDVETGLPEDSELARRQIIKDRNKKKLREQGRAHYQTQEDDKLDDMLKVLNQKEKERQQRRLHATEKEQEKAAKKTTEPSEVASIN